MIIIDDIFVEGNAHRDGRLCIGDRILEINGEDYASRTLAEAMLALGGVVPLMRLTIYRDCLDEGVFNVRTRTLLFRTWMCMS